MQVKDDLDSTFRKIALRLHPDRLDGRHVPLYEEIQQAKDFLNAELDKSLQTVKNAVSAERLRKKRRITPTLVPESDAASNFISGQDIVSGLV